MERWNAAKQCIVVDADVYLIAHVNAKKLTGQIISLTVKHCFGFVRRADFEAKQQNMM